MRFRWTHRLRDYLAARDYYVEVTNKRASILSQIREVELCEDVPKLGKRTLDAATSQLSTDPAVPDFETFRKCYSDLTYGFIFKEKPSRSDILTSLVIKPEFHSPEVSLAEMQRNREKFHVIWLSNTAFVSPMQFTFKAGRTREWFAMDYAIYLRPRGANQLVCFSVHSLDPSEQAPSIHRFLSEMLKGYAADYISLICLESHRKHVPSLMSFNILSIIPSNSSSEKDASPVNVRNITTVEFLCNLDTDTVQAILLRGSQKNIPIRYQFQNQQLGAVLRHCSQLQHVSIDENPDIWEPTENSPPLFTENCSLESASIFLGSSFQSNVLNGIVCNPSVKKLFLLIDFRGGWEGFLQQRFTDAVSGGVHLNELIVAFCHCQSLESDTIRSGLRSLVATCGVTKSGSLRRLSVVEYPSGFYVWPHVELQLESDASDAFWDTNMSPALAMNWCKYESDCSKAKAELSKHVSEQDFGEDGLSLSLLPRKVQAVNRGVVYRKSTLHTPHDMSTANASVLFAFVQASLLPCNKV
jgi:hypothetical protein